MKIYENIWKQMKINKNHGKSSMEINNNIWKLMKIDRDTRKSIKICENP